MRINIPLLPIAVEVRWRRLRPFRVRLRGLLFVVAVAALFFSLIAQVGRAGRAVNYHTERAFLAAEDRLSTGGAPSPLEAWHSSMAGRSRAEFERIDLLAFLALLTLATLGAVAALGRALDWSSRRMGIPMLEGPTDPLAISPQSPNPDPEVPGP